MDPISDMFIRIKNASRAGHETVLLPYSKFKHELAKVLEKSGFVKAVERKGKRVRKSLEVVLKYENDEPAIHEIKLISKASRRVYAPYRKLGRQRHGGIIIVSTPKGVMMSSEAKKQKVGGEFIAEVW
ncbi:MAG: 30S ribosomal protein S8 [Candidatus Sungiibacteriota bacterium]|uniref:Small ribosomal subunit protein uS8 n=1 Tax=Candidatus Sungiibacteriota bacterium TaxID=2750080 RepID=A0A7T5UR24_9BACT|nr:MAG: 30S ribosomal protein S8 [Candidatus Sungbacteria bacterium]